VYGPRGRKILKVERGGGRRRVLMLLETPGLAEAGLRPILGLF